MKTQRITLLLIFFLFASLPAASRDLIFFKSGKEVEVLITKEDDKEIRFKDLQTGASQKVSVDDIETIFYEDAPPSYRDAITNLKGGQAKTALVALNSMKKRGLPKTRLPWVKAYVDFYIAKSWATLARAANSETAAKILPQALKQLSAFEKSHAKSRFLPEAIYLRGMCELKGQKYDAGRKVFTELSKNGDKPYWAAKAQAGIAQSYLIEKDYDKAEHHCLSQLKLGRFSGEIIEILGVILIDRKLDGKKALAVGKNKKLLSHGDREVRRAANELAGAAQVLLKNYEEGLLSLLRSRLLYSNSRTHGSRSNIYTALAIKHLMQIKPDDYPEWDYNPKFFALYKGFRSSDQRVYSKVLKSLK